MMAARRMCSAAFRSGPRLRVARIPVQSSTVLGVRDVKYGRPWLMAFSELDHQQVQRQLRCHPAALERQIYGEQAAVRRLELGERELLRQRQRFLHLERCYARSLGNLM